MDNKLPKGWKIATLKSISHSIQYGYTESSSKEKIGPKFLRITDIQDNKVSWEDVPYCKIDNNIKSKYLLKEGDLVFARTGATVGKSFLIKGKIPETVFASYLIRVRVSIDMNEKYLSYFFHSPDYWQQITNDQVGTGQPNVNGTKLGLLKITIAPIPIQHAIVSKIEELFSELDKGIEDLKIAQQQLKIYRQSVLKWAFEGLKEQKTIEEITQESLIGLVRSNAFQNYNLIGVPYVKMNNIDMNGLVDYSELVYIEANDQEIEKFSLKKDDILLNTRNSFELVGKTGIVRENKENVLFNNNILRIRTKPEYSPLFILYQLVGPDLRKQMLKEKKATTSVCALYQRDILPLKVKISDIKEQHQIVQEIESRLSVADKMEESIKESLLKAEAFRQSILKKAFSGELI